MKNNNVDSSLPEHPFGSETPKRKFAYGAVKPTPKEKTQKLYGKSPNNIIIDDPYDMTYINLLTQQIIDSPTPGCDSSHNNCHHSQDNNHHSSYDCSPSCDSYDSGGCGGCD